MDSALLSTLKAQLLAKQTPLPRPRCGADFQLWVLG